LLEGEADGIWVGTVEGTRDGATDGEADGIWVGIVEGERDGESEGMFRYTQLSSIDPTPSFQKPSPPIAR